MVIPSNGHYLTLISYFGFCFTLIALALIDMKSLRLPNYLTIPLLLSGVVLSFFGVTIPIADAILGATLAYATLLITQLLYQKLTERHGLGFGDIKLAAALGAWLGWQSLPEILIIASISASIAGTIYLISTKQNRYALFAFGPFLILGAFVTLFTNPALLRL